MKINDRLIEKTCELRGLDTDYSACFRCNVTVKCLKPKNFFMGRAKGFMASSLRRNSFICIFSIELQHPVQQALFVSACCFPAFFKPRMKSGAIHIKTLRALAGLLFCFSGNQFFYHGNNFFNALLQWQ